MNDEFNPFECAVLAGLAAIECAVVLLALALFATAREPVRQSAPTFNPQLQIP